MAQSCFRKIKLQLLLKGRCKRMTLWTFLKSDRLMQSPQNSMHKTHNQSQRASFCICNKASYTLEAAVVIPLLAAYLVTLLFFFTILDIQCAVDDALLFAGRKTAVESSVVDSEEVLFLSAEAYMCYALKDNSQIKKYVPRGLLGISLLGSKISGEYIVLRADYVVELPISFLGINQLNLTSQNCFRKWTGDRLIEDAGEYVYVTAAGQVYHASLSCRVIDLSIKRTSIYQISSLRGKNGQKYYECGRCKWKDDEKERVYYTDYGERYHKDIACSALKRTVEKIRLEDVDGRRPCSFCYEL